MKILWSDGVWATTFSCRSKTLKQIHQLLQDAMRNGCARIGKPEPLKGDLPGWWSSHIDVKAGSYIAYTMGF